MGILKYDYEGNMPLIEKYWNEFRSWPKVAKAINHPNSDSLCKYMKRNKVVKFLDRNKYEMP